MSFVPILNANENIQLEVIPKKGIMLHANDLFKIFTGIFILTIAFTVGFTEHIGFLAFGIIILFLMLKAVYNRYNNTNGITYLITNERVLFLKNGNIIKQKEFKNINEINYENSGNDRGYIILGEVEDLFENRGISFEEDICVLDNLTNYKEVSTLLKKLMENKKTAHNTI
ncbi:hypothetical protein [Aestuariibaculum lutulentum]|uniref:PH domain-containing protein n=1 Tax=Aestuariibaculum lutulentum TaxID=2920935 RepID=A0ABS9RKS7_9FLAO|nr:hypothetical protein [Aestuariibaculum lutulentum]MCH4553560.1 hypothetical protein [Aestuariibaculum lutulentum]